VVVGENYGTLEILGAEWEFAAYGCGLRLWKRRLHFFFCGGFWVLEFWVKFWENFGFLEFLG
jgi:hypothetical protein